MPKIVPIPAFQDNYIWAIHSLEGSDLIVVDPGDAAPVLAYLQNNNLTLSTILITHHHWDHTGGIADLKARFPSVKVIGPRNDKVDGLTQSVQEGEPISLEPCGITLTVLEIPGHTLEHIAYFNDTLLFCGDTLFSCGCGRIFEGTPQQMYDSLDKIKHLNKDVRVYCGHEYTTANIAFAKTIEPHNTDLLAYEKHVLSLRSLQLPSLPSQLCTELKTNPFLRCENENVIRAVQKNANIASSDPVTIFAKLREWKNHFKA